MLPKYFSKKLGFILGASLLFILEFLKNKKKKLICLWQISEAGFGFLMYTNKYKVEGMYITTNLKSLYLLIASYSMINKTHP